LIQLTPNITVIDIYSGAVIYF